MLKEALYYADQGWPVLPVHTIIKGKCSCGKDCGNPGKHPVTQHGVNEATTNKERIEKWFQRPYNIGLRTGQVSGIVVLDIDPKNGGFEAMAQVEEKYGPVPDTLEVISGSGGRHIWFAAPEGKQLKGKSDAIAPGVDTRAEGNYIIVPPSVHISGGIYQWDLGMIENPLANVPKWLLDLWVKAAGSTQMSGKVPDKIKDGARHETLLNICFTLHAKGLCQESILAALQSENQLRCVPPMKDREVEAIVKSMKRPGGEGAGQHAQKKPRGGGGLPPCLSQRQNEFDRLLETIASRARV